MEVLPDQVQLLVGRDPQVGIHRLVQRLKGYSSPALRAEFPALQRRLPSLWTTSSFVATVGGVTLEALKCYVENQKGKEEERRRSGGGAEEERRRSGGGAEEERRRSGGGAGGQDGAPHRPRRRVRNASASSGGGGGGRRRAQ